MALTQRLEFRQSQSLVMTPQLMQAIKLLQLSNLDLSAFVEEELERNPLLERANDGTEPPVAGEPAPERAEFSDRDLVLVVDPSVCGSNFKVSNLENMIALAKHDIFVIADSDMRVGTDYLTAVTAPLAEGSKAASGGRAAGGPVRRTWASRAAAAKAGVR